MSGCQGWGEDWIREGEGMSQRTNTYQICIIHGHRQQCSDSQRGKGERELGGVGRGVKMGTSAIVSTIKIKKISMCFHIHIFTFVTN